MGRRLKVEEAVRLLQERGRKVSARTIRRWINSGFIRAEKEVVPRPQGGGRKAWVIPEEEIERILSHLDNHLDTDSHLDGHLDSHLDTKTTPTTTQNRHNLPKSFVNTKMTSSTQNDTTSSLLRKFYTDVRNDCGSKKTVENRRVKAKFEDGEWWLSVEDCGSLLRKSDRQVRQLIIEGKLKKFRKVPARNRQKFQYEIALSSLPEEARRRFWAGWEGEREVVLEGLEEMRKEINLPANPTEEDIKRMRVVYEAQNVPKGKKKDEWYGEVGRRYGVSKQTVYRWLQKFKEGRLFKKRERPGEVLVDVGVEVRAWDREAVEFAIGLILENRWDKKPAKELYKEVVRWAEGQNLRVGSYVSFTKLVQAVLGSPLRVLRDKGKRGLIEEVVPEIRRDFSVYAPMELLVGDQHKCDYVCFDDNLNVMWLEGYHWADARTGLVFSALCYKHYDRFVVGLALKEALLWGIPKELYNDWGKCENSLYVRKLRGRLSKLVRILEGEELIQRHAQVRRPQSKPIEGIFAQLDRRMRARDIPGYAKRRADAKENELMQKELKRLIRQKKLLHYRELMEEILGVVDAWNWHVYRNRQVVRDNGRSPWEIFKEECSGVAGLSEQAAEWLVLPEPKKKIRVRNGKVGFKHPFWGRVEFWAAELAEVNGQEVEVRFYPWRADRCFVLVDGEVVVCERWGLVNPKDEAETRRKMGIQNSIVEHFAELMARYRAKVRAYVREKMKVSAIVPEIRQAQKAAEKVRRFEVLKEKEGRKPSTFEIYEAINARR